MNAELPGSLTHSSRPLDAMTAAFIDIDNTLLHGSSLFYLGWGAWRHGYFSVGHLPRFLVAGLRYHWTRKERVDDVRQWGDFATAFIAGRDAEEIHRTAGWIYDGLVADLLDASVIAMAHTHLDRGEEVWLASTTPQGMASLMAERLGFTGGVGSPAEVTDGRYTGRMAGPILHGSAKAEAVVLLAQRRGIDLTRSHAYSDSIHDLPLLSSVGNPHVVRPDRTLRRQALQKGWPIHEPPGWGFHLGWRLLRGLLRPMPRR